jgi:hypothetical protein
VQDRCEIPGLNLGTAFVTARLECGRGGWNSACSSEMRRYAEEHRWRRQSPWACTDAHARKRGEQTGLDTLVVHALNDVNWLLDGLLFSNEANA